tara:strand:- start:383 stop:2488 length:2106 start_codon:yes stop_codon:yes gene_type:complete
MPNWKKVVVSGSNAHLSEVTSSDGIKTTTINASGTITGNSFSGDGSSLSGVSNFSVSNASMSRFVQTNADGTAGQATSRMWEGGSYIYVSKDIMGNDTNGFRYYAGDSDGPGPTQGAVFGYSTNTDYGGYIQLKDVNGFQGVQFTGGNRKSWIYSGSLGLGTTAPDTKLHISSYNREGTGQFHIEAVGDGVSGSAFMTIEARSARDAGIYFKNNNQITTEMIFDDTEEHFKIGSGSNYVYFDKESGDVTASNHISASGNIIADEFYGDGSNLTGVVAGGVTFANVSGKPTLVSGSGQINDLINDTIAATIVAEIDNDEIPIAKLASDAITIAGNSTTLGGSITAATILDGTQVFSGSAQLPSGIISGSAQLPSGTISGSSQLPSGIISGSGATSITTLGTIVTGTWNGSQIATSNTEAKVTAVNAGTGIDVNQTTGAVTVTAEAASHTNAGVIEIATTAETTTGTDTTRAVSPDGLKDGYQGSTVVTTLGTIGTGTWNAGNVTTTGTGSFGRVEATKLKGDGSEITGLTAAAIQTYSSTGDNRIITSVNATSVQGESGLTFDGSALEVNGSITSTGNITTLGDVIAENYIVSSSVTHMTQSFSSGSTIFGDGSADTHQFTGSLLVSGSITPGGDALFDLGSATKRFANIYSADFHLSNENTEGNEIDGTNGNWTIQEGEEDLYLLNNKNGKKYKFKLEEIK